MRKHCAAEGMSFVQMRDQLMRDVERYLRAVEVFREEGLEPCWADR